MDLNKELVLASEAGNETTVIELLNKDADPNTMGPNSGALHCAAFNGHAGIVKLLLEKAANPNVADHQSYYPLHLAASKKELEIVKHLLAHGADLNAVTSSLGTVLHIAAAINFHEILDLDAIKNVDLEARDHEQKTALNVAASLGHLEMAKALVELGANVNTSDSDNNSPLLNAIFRADNTKVGQWQSVGMNSGVSAKYEIINGCFRYIKPFNGDQNELGEVLPTEDQYEIAGYSWGPAAHLPYLDSVQLITFLIDNHADVNHVGIQNTTPMIAACSVGEPDVIMPLVVKGARFDVKNEIGISPLHYLARSKRLDGLYCYFRLSNDKNPNLYDDNGWTPAHFLADIGGHPEMAKILLLNGIDLNSASTKELGPFPLGVKAFEVAQHWNDSEMAALLSPESNLEITDPNESIYLRFVSCDDIDLDILVTEDLSYELENESLSMDKNNLFPLVSFLFQTPISAMELKSGTYYDLTDLKNKCLLPEQLEEKYEQWFRISHIQDSKYARKKIEEIVAFVQKNKEAKHLLLLDEYIWNVV